MGERKYSDYRIHAHIMNQNWGGKCYCRAANALLPVDKLPCADCPLWNGEARQPCCVYYDFDGANDLSPAKSKKRTAMLIASDMVKEFPDFIGEFRMSAHHWKKSAGIYERALQFAAKAHKGGHRGIDKLPRVVHSIEVSMITFELLWEEEENTLRERDYAVMAAAALHDVEEYTKYTYDDIKMVLGSYAAGLVRSLRGAGRNDELSPEEWKEQKEAFLRYLGSSAREVKMIALADLLSDTRLAVKEHAKSGDSIFAVEPGKDKAVRRWYCYAAADKLNALSGSKTYKEYIRLCDKLFKE